MDQILNDLAIRIIFLMTSDINFANILNDVQSITIKVDAKRTLVIEGLVLSKENKNDNNT